MTKRRTGIPRRTPPLTLSLLACLLALSVRGGAADCGKLAGVQRWYGNFTLTLNETSVWEPPKEGSIQGVKLYERVALSADGSFTLAQDEDFKNDYRADQPGFLGTCRTETWAVDSSGTDNHIVGEGASLADNANHALLSLNCARRTYTFTVGVGRFALKSRLEDPRVCHVPGGETACAFAKESVAAQKDSFSLVATVTDQALDPNATRLSGSAEVDTNHDGKSGKPMRALLTWTLSTTPIPEEVQVTVQTDSAYEKWIPEGNLMQPGEPGNRIGVKLIVHKKGDPTERRKATLTVALMKVSQEKGVCMNWPVKGAKADFGLRLPAGENPAFAPSPGAGAGQPLTTRAAVDAAEVLVTGHDFGAYGVLHITGKDAVGRDVRVVIRGKDSPDLALPMDENHNHIADAWEKNWAGGLRGQETDDDEDVPSGQAGSTGDGLTLYEEYRGFKVSGGPERIGDAHLPLELITGQHVRTDPRVKDLFVSDRTRRRVGGSGVVHFGNATGVRVHQLAADEIGDNRIVTLNSGSWHSVDQHGILLIDGPPGSDPQQIPLNPESRAFGPPGMTRQVSLPPGRDFSSGDGMADVAHELSHAVGLQHHGDGPDYPADWYWQLSPDGAWQLYEQKIVGKDVQTARDKTKSEWVPDPDSPPRPVQVYWEPKNAGEASRPFRKEDGPPAGSQTVGPDRWRLWVGAQNGMFSGDQECLMRYYDKQAYLSKAEPDRVRYVPDERQWKMRDRLCENGNGTGVNASSHYPQSRYGDAVVGNCRSQLVVNDKYAK